VVVLLLALPLLLPLLCGCDGSCSTTSISEPFLPELLKLGALICAAVGVVGVPAPISLEAFELSSVS